MESHLSELRQLIDDMDKLDHESMFRAAWSWAPMGAMISRDDGTIIRVNNMLMWILGYTSDANTKKPFKERGWKVLSHPDDVDVCLANLNNRTKEEDFRCRARKRYIRQDGSYIWVEVSSLHFYDPDIIKGPFAFVWISVCSDQNYNQAEVLEVGCGRLSE